MENLLTIKQAAQTLGLSTWYISKQVKAKALPVVRLSRRCTRIRPSDLETFCAEHLQIGSRVNAEKVKP